MTLKLLFHKITHWEYWPFGIVYIPVYFLWGYYALKTKTIFFFNAANPSIKNGGFVNESKKEIYDLIPNGYYPKTEFIKQGLPYLSVEAVLQQSGINYPFIAKPDIGLQGTAVKKIHHSEELKTYATKANFDYLLQELIPYDKEIGIFYIRYPNENTGTITGIVSKEFMIITGDGKSTIETILKQNPRYQLQLQKLQKEYGAKLQDVLQQGETLNLVPYGNHARGAKFTDRSDWATPALNNVINDICIQIDGFYFGRIDLMYNSLAELEQGKNFSIVELNGAGSEPTHIYDPTHSLLFAWKELLRHNTIMYRISVQNHKKGIPYLTHKEGMEQYRLHNLQFEKIINF